MFGLISMASFSMKGLTGKWSKWGGDIDTGGIQKEKIEDYWFCQSCGEEQPEELSPYLFNYDRDVFIRICHKCLNSGCALLMRSRIEIELEI